MKKIVILGLPETGKTTFLAALWHILCSSDLNSTLKLEKYFGDLQYLNDIKEKWLGYETVARTKTLETKPNHILIKNQKNGSVFDLEIPDLSGELFEHIIYERVLPKEFDEIIANSTIFLLFINPSDTIGFDEIEDLDEIFSEKNVDLGSSTETNELDDYSKINIWSIDQANSQIKLVEIIQMILFRKKSNINLGLILSAWDKIDQAVLSSEYNINPANWLKNNLPLLYQFISSNKLINNYFIAGVSAQGGDYKDNLSTLTPLLPSERVKIVLDDRLSNDVTFCLSKLLS